ncbi:biosynthetic arginine decarboxylase [Falsihalocynthiibacter arcticus]|uniref:biosynthetic arginine decarboxylase n=1 Tax=Falsihalocynthiibacter arcticus TaxID=1579316 RepID=UPI000A9374AC|nr:biosynthetic arginine decarboxylase [Falsihalocynthiibacter arcticus]
MSEETGTLTELDTALTHDNTAANSVYAIERWGKDLVGVLPNGDLGLRNPLKPDAPMVSLPVILQDLEERGVHAPLLLRVSSFLESSIRALNESFASAIKRAGYKNEYRAVFPVKVNQQAQVISRIVEFGKPYSHGLEAGSKPELVIALAQPLAHDALIVCNGVKDAEFIRLAILSRKLGFNTVIVLESPKELQTVLAVVKELGEEPQLGVRVKLSNRISGNWAESSGDRSTFGMHTDQLVDVIDSLKEAGLIHCLKFQHSHLGSQIPDVNDVRRATGEACRYFVELTREGAPLTHLDLGGGLGVDYTGEKSTNENSINYSVDEYCTNIVETVSYALDEAKIPHPILVTESGRAVVATSSMLIFNVLEATLYDSHNPTVPAAEDHHFVSDLAAVSGYLEPQRLQECINDSSFYRNELRALFRRGYIDLRQMARAERIYLHLMSKIKSLAPEVGTAPDVDAHLEQLADIYHCNFSLFQSLPDVWAIDQVHPLVPLQMLNVAPDRRAVLSDITCDSDGKIDKFILADGISPSLPVHTLDESKPYYIGVFYVGAYQETLGDLHNLFGDTNVATIDLRDDGSFDLLHEQEGDTIAEVLSYVEYDPRDCVDAFRARIDNEISHKRLNPKDRKTLLAAYRDSINGYTYYE